MNIGFVFSNLLIGGAQDFHVSLAIHFSHIYNVRVSIYSYKLASPLLLNEINKLDAVSLEELSVWSDIIQLDGMLPLEGKRILKKKWNYVIESFHSYPRMISRKEIIFRKNHPKTIITNSLMCQKSLILKSYMIPVGKDINFFKPLDLVKKYDLVIVGRMRKIKNHKLFLEICKKGNFSFVAIGGTARAEEGHINDIEQEVRSFARAEIDYVAGWVPYAEVPVLINQAKMAVVCSDSESGPTPIEPMACGVPCISRNLGGVSEAFKDLPDLLVPYNAPAEVYVEKIKKYIDDKELRKKVREIAVNGFSRNDSFRKYEEIYLNVLKKKRW